VLRPTYPILSDRLALRPPTVADAPAIAAYKSSPDVTRWVPHGPLPVEAIAERAGRALTGLDDEGQSLNLLVHERGSGGLVGDVVLFWRSREHRAGELGYIFDPAFAGRGYATEAAREVLRLAFDKLGLHRVVGRIYAENLASARVLERLGMRREAHFLSNETLRGEWTDEIVYALLEHEWSGQRLGEVGEQIVDVLDADRQPDEIVGHLQR
jgi:RimJ/RimL family protein N-acetyltransferase